MLEPLLYFGGTVFATIVVTAVVCRFQLAHSKPISYDALILCPVVANMIVFGSFAFYEEGWEIFTRDAWSGGKDDFGSVLFVLAVMTALCILPALGVAVYY